MEEENKWNKIVIMALLSSKDFDIKEIRNFESITSLLFDAKKYKQILDLITQKDWGNIKSLDSAEKTGFGEYLYVLKFSDQNEISYAVTIYDNDELWQDPEIIDIIRLT